MLATAPGDVRLLFDDEVRPAGGDLAVDSRGRSVLAGPAHRLPGNGRALVIPLRPGLPRGAYSLRWRVVSNDGHLISGVLAFAVGAGAPRPVPTLSAGGGTSGTAVFLRLLFIAGVLARRRRCADDAAPRRAGGGCARSSSPRRSRSSRPAASGCSRSSRPPTPPGSAG